MTAIDITQLTDEQKKALQDQLKGGKSQEREENTGQSHLQAVVRGICPE